MAYIYNPSKSLVNRRKLRKDEPLTEKVLWSKLRNRGLLGFKFRRQYGIKNYIVDFCCSEVQLIIEIDGDSHYVDEQTVSKDRARQKDIEALGFIFLRFTNKDIVENLEGVSEVISKKLKELIHNLT
ncbi:MAG: endonuclease domain-containing protein [Candidatus Doudnabacteria bacterium]|nr:endonuclease domain-containing protein [Candidatus Doudnabacteria bacterium]